MNKENLSRKHDQLSLFRIRRPRLTRRAAVLLAVMALTLVMTSVALADIQLPAPGSAFIQTSGNQTTLGTGDYRTNIAGDNDVHVMDIIIPCVPYAFDFYLFDPSLDVPGTVLDEIRPAASTGDDALFRLVGPDNTQIIPATGTWLTYGPGSADDVWTDFHTVDMSDPLNPPAAGSNCGTYTLETRTGSGSGLATANDDDNAWIFSLRGNDQDPDNDPNTNDETFNPLLGPDGIQGTGDEAYIGETALSFQHGANSCQDFYWVVGDGQTNMFMTNFDMDNIDQVCYFPPGVGGTCTYGGTAPAGAVTGTVSGNTVWNDTTPTATRPTFNEMALFDPAAADLAGDAIVNPDTGVWRATICVNPLNQYSFEVCNAATAADGCSDRKIVFLEEPILPNLTIAKTDGVTNVNSPGQTTYTLTLTNTGQGAAMPISGPEVVDQLPPGTTFNSCTVNAPLVGTCTNAGGGTINVELQAQSATVPAFLTGASGGANVGTITVVANIDPGLTVGTTLDNVATLDYTDLLGTNYPEETANDIDTVIGNVPYADLSLNKSLDSNSGTTAQFTLSVTNDGPDDAFGVQVTDQLPAEFTNFTLVNASQGTYTEATGVWDVGDLANGQTETLTFSVDYDPADLPLTNIAEITQVLDNVGAPLIDLDSVPNNGVPTEDDQDTVTLGASNPGSGGSSGSSSKNAPPIIYVDPAITKRGDPLNAIVGETIVFTVTISNPTDGDITNVVIHDDVPPMFDVVSATTTQGAVSHQGRTYYADVGTLASGATATLTITTVANAVASPPETCNVAVVGSVGSNEVCPNIFPGALPATGSQPVEGNGFAARLTLLGLMGLALAAFLVRRQQTA